MKRPIGLAIDAGAVRLSPIFDVVTTSVYRFERPGGAPTEDRTLALKWLRGKTFADRHYPTYPQLADFAARPCRGARDPAMTVRAIADAMRATLINAETDARVPRDFLALLCEQWVSGLAYADEAPPIPRRR